MFVLRDKASREYLVSMSTKNGALDTDVNIIYAREWKTKKAAIMFRRDKLKDVDGFDIVEKDNGSNTDV